MVDSMEQTLQRRGWVDRWRLGVLVFGQNHATALRPRAIQGPRRVNCAATHFASFIAHRLDGCRIAVHCGLWCTWVNVYSPMRDDQGVCTFAEDMSCWTGGSGQI